MADVQVSGQPDRRAGDDARVPAAGAAAGPRPPTVAIHSAVLQRAKRRAALRTFWLPVAGTAVAAVSAFWLPVGALELAVLAGMFVWVTLGLEVGFHRMAAHKAFSTHRWMQVLLWVSALMAGQGGGTYWIAQHRRHHAHSDTPLDPHSPVAASPAGGRWQDRLRGLWHAHQGHTWRDPSTNVMLFAPDLVRDPLWRRLDRQHTFWVGVGLVIPALVGAAVTQTWQGAWNCLLWGGPVRILVQHQLFFTNSSIAHAFGEQRFDTGDNSRNNWLCALWTFGSALQNTHHAFASSAYLSQRWYEIDIAGWAIRALSATGLAWEVRLPDAEQLQARRLAPAGPSARGDRGASR